MLILLVYSFQNGSASIILQKTKFRLDFSLNIRYNIKVANKKTSNYHLERYSNGKEPHWKCGVPQGIERSSRFLSAKKEKQFVKNELLFFFYCVFYDLSMYQCKFFLQNIFLKATLVHCFERNKKRWSIPHFVRYVSFSVSLAQLRCRF